MYGLRSFRTFLEVLTDIVKVIEDPSVHALIERSSKKYRESFIKWARANVGQTGDAASEATVEAAILRIGDEAYREAVQSAYRGADSVIAALLLATSFPRRVFLTPLHIIEKVLRDDYFAPTLGKSAAADHNKAVRDLIDRGFARDIVDKIADRVAALPRTGLFSRKYSLVMAQPEAGKIIHLFHVSKEFVWSSNWRPGYLMGVFFESNNPEPMVQPSKDIDKVKRALLARLGSLSNAEFRYLESNWERVEFDRWNNKVVGRGGVWVGALNELGTLASRVTNSYLV